MSSDPNASPFNAVPPVIVALAAVVFGVEVILTLGAQGILGGQQAVGWRLWALQSFSVPGPLLEEVTSKGLYQPQYLIRYLTYSFVHYSFTHMIFVAVFLLALGKMVGEVFSTGAVLLVFFGSAIVGALIYGLVGDTSFLTGGYPAVFGLIGAFTWLLWVDLAARGANKYRAFALIGALLFIRLVFGLLFGASLAWIAEVAGFAAGFALSFLVSPGGWQRMLAKLRQR